MTHRVVYDTMLFVQAAALRPPRLHGTFKAIEDSSESLAMSDDLFDEIRRVLTDPETRSILPSLEPPRVVSFLDAIRRSSLWQQEWLKQAPAETESLLLQFLIARNLERIAGHVTNLAEDVICMVEGEIVRHSVDRF